MAGEGTLLVCTSGVFSDSSRTQELPIIQQKNGYSCDSPAEEKHDEKRGLSDPFNPTPQARPYVPASGRSNYLLEAAAALVHMEFSREILRQRDFLPRNNLDMKKALFRACRNGHEEVAKLILDEIDDDDVALQETLHKAASQNHMSVGGVPLTYNGAAESRSSLLRSAVRNSLKLSSFIEPKGTIVTTQAINSLSTSKFIANL